MNAFARTLAVSILAVLLGVPALVAEDAKVLSTATSPPARLGHSMVVVNGEAYVFGGTDYSTTYNDLWKWDQSAETWVELSPSYGSSGLPPARFYHAATEMEGGMYIAYGMGETTTLGDFWQYHPGSNYWSPVTVVGGPSPNWMSAMTHLGDNRIFVGGGCSTSSCSDPEDGINMYIINFGGPAKTAVLGADHIMSLSEGRYGFVAAAAGGHPLILTGFNLDLGGPTGEIHIWSAEPPPMGSWSTKTPHGDVPQGRAFPAVARWWDYGKDTPLGEMVFIFGGESSDKQFSPSTTIQSYNTRTNTWTVYAEVLPVAVHSAGAALLPPGPGDTSGNLQAFIFGGTTPTGVTDITVHLDTDVPYAPVETVYSYWTEIAANLEGSFGSQWRTDVVARNLGSSDATIDFLLHIDATHAYLLQDNVVSPGAQGVFEDVVGMMNYTGKGALEIQSSEMLHVSSRMYNQADTGTFGQFFDGYTWADGLSAGEVVYLLQLRQLTDTFRTNISVTNTGTETATVEITLYATDGTELHSYTLDVDPGTVYQDSQPFNYRAGSPDLGWGYARVEVLAGNGILTSASVVDSNTNDATTIPMKF